MQILSKPSIEAIIIFQTLLTNNSVFKIENNEKIFIEDDLKSFTETLSIKYLSNFFISNTGKANEMFDHFFQDNNNEDISLATLFQFAAMFQLLKDGFEGNEENIKDFEIELMAEIAYYFDTLTFLDVYEFVFQEEDIILFNSDVETRGELVEEQMDFINEFNLEEKMNNFLINILSNRKDKFLTILSDENEETFRIHSVTKGAFVGYQIDDIKELLVSLYKLNITGGMVLVKAFTGEHTDDVPNYEMYSYSVFDKVITASSKEDLMDSFSFDMISGEPLEQEVGISYIDSPFKV